METRIRALREDKDMSQTEMGKLLGISQRSYAYYESGERTIPLEILVAIANIHHVSIDYLLYQSDTRTMDKQHPAC